MPGLWLWRRALCWGTAAISASTPEWDDDSGEREGTHMKKWLTRLLFDWVFVLLYRLFQSFLNLVDFIKSFFGHDAVTNAFWAMALIAMVLSVGF